VQQVLAELQSHGNRLGQPLSECRALLLAAMQASDDGSRLAQQALAAAEALQEQYLPGSSSKSSKKDSSNRSGSAAVLHVQGLAHGLLASAMANQAAQQGLMARHSKQQPAQQGGHQEVADGEAARQALPSSVPEEVSQLWQEQRQHMQVCLKAWQQAQDAAERCTPAGADSRGCLWRYPAAEVQLLLQLWHAAGLQGRATDQAWYVQHFWERRRRLCSTGCGYACMRAPTDAVCQLDLYT
jgi:hypothetical protein